jgi:hypothetical protein
VAAGYASADASVRSDCDAGVRAVDGSHRSPPQSLSVSLGVSRLLDSGIAVIGASDQNCSGRAAIPALWLAGMLVATRRRAPLAATSEPLQLNPNDKRTELHKRTRVVAADTH